MSAKSRAVEIRNPVALGLLAWFAAELCAFALVVSVLGLAGALLLGLLTSVLGFSLLRRLGRSAATSLRQMFDSKGMVFQQAPLVDGTLTAIGGTLLILPGFLSDLVGLALVTPSVRFWLAGWMKWDRPRRGQTKPRRVGVIELSTEEWRRVDDIEPDLRRHP